MPEGKVYDFRDPIHGFIAVNELERRLIDTRPFQRLRHVRQLGTTFLVYPGANHTRFEHSLGTMFVANQMYQLITQRFGKDLRSALRWNDEDVKHYRRILRLAALLHDLGHPPFSHASENLMPEGMSHEHYTRLIIQDTDIHGVLKQGGLSDQNIREVAQLATGGGARERFRTMVFLGQFLTGELGADRIDYLIRDSHHIGVGYDRFDFHRLLRTMEFAMLPSEEPPHENAQEKQPTIVIEQGGLHAVEGMLLARYFMFLQVYFHKTRRILDIHLTECLSELDELEGGRYPTAIEELIQWDDDRVLHLLKNDEHRHKHSTRRLLQREHFKLLHETKAHATLDELRTCRLLHRDLEQRFGKDALRLDDGEALELRKAYSYVDPSGIRIRMIAGEHAGRFLPLVSREEEVPGASSLLAQLRQITMARIYCDRKRFPQIKREYDSLCEEMNGARGGIGI